MAVEQLGGNGPDGMNIGISATADKVSFFSATPVVQPTSASQAAVTATAVTASSTTAATTTTPHGFGTGTQADTLVARVNQCIVDVGALTTLTNQIRTELVALGLITGS